MVYGSPVRSITSYPKSCVSNTRIRQLLVTSKIMSATIIPLGISHTIVDPKCHSWVGLLDTSQLQILWKLIIRVEAFRSDPAQILRPVSNMHEAFTSRNLPSTFGRQPSAMAVANIVLMVSWTQMTKNSKGSSSHLVLGFFVSFMIIRGSIVDPNGITSFNLSMYIHIHVCIINNF